MSNVIPGEIERTTRKLVRSLRAYEDATAAFADAYRRRTASDRTAAQAQRDLDSALTNGTWLQGEVTALGAALAGLCLSQMGEPR